MQDIQALFADYASHHRTKGNKWFHRFGIPLLMVSLIGMLARVGFRAGNGLRLDAAMLLIAVATIYYLRLQWGLGLAMLIASIACYVAGVWLPFWVNVALFILGLIFQYIGHAFYEHKQPAFVKNLVHILVGPLWILNDAIPIVKMAPSNPTVTSS